MAKKKRSKSPAKKPSRRPRAPSLTRREMDQILFPVVEMFIEDYGADRISSEVLRQFGIRLTREAVYPVVRDAVRRGYLKLLPPRDENLRRAIRTFSNPDGHIRVVDTRGHGVPENVASVGADTIVELIGKVALAKQEQLKERGSDERPVVHIGLGIGQTTMRTVRQLAAHLRSDSSLPKIVVHSLSTPHSVHDPLETPLASFALFSDAYEKPDYVGLVTEPVVPCKEYEAVKKRPSVRKAFLEASKIDILLTSMAAADDDHGYLYRYVEEYTDGPGRGTKAALIGAGWVGDVQMRPYSRTGPIEITRGVKPVTLFEIADLVGMARKPGKYVVLLCSPCGHCQGSKAGALLPLLTKSSLQVWTHLVIDVATAQEVVDLQYATQGGAGV